MNLNWNANPPQVTGTMQVAGSNGWTASLLAELAGNTLPSAEYTLLLPPGTNSAPGDSYALITNHLGTATVTGSLADGTAFSESVAVSSIGDVPVYASPYASGGLVLGWLNLTDGGVHGNLTWIRPAGSSLFTDSLTNGFTNMASVQGERWINPPPTLRPFF